MVLKVKRISPDAKLPNYSHPADAGLNIYANEEIIIPPQERRIISTGIAMAIPFGYVGLIWDRSSISSQIGLKILGGVIDAGYRGEIKVIIHNLTPQAYKVEKGLKIGQMLIQPVEQKEVVEVQELDETERGSGGFGSTGTK